MARLQMVLAFAACQFLFAVSVYAADAIDVKIAEQLATPTKIDCKEFPPTELLDFVADLHGIPVSLDQAEIKRIGLDLEPLAVTITTNRRLDEALTTFLEPFKLSFMIDDGKLLITSKEKAKEWQDAYAEAWQEVRAKQGKK